MQWLAEIRGDVIRFMDQAPDFAIQGAILLSAILAAVMLHLASFILLERAVSRSTGSFPVLVRTARRPMRLAFIAAAIGLALPVMRIGPVWESRLQHLSLILMIVLIGWTAMVLLNHFTECAVARRRLDEADNLAARKYVTQVRVLRRVASVLIIIVTLSACLLTFDGVQEYGASLLASAGAAGLILGLAARPVLANLIAGIQIALTQPIRLDDVVIVEGEWGWVEEIFSTYVVVRLWDWRRMVVPLSYFIEKPFQNWTRESASIIGAVFWYMDYTVPVDRVRAKLEELVRASPYWDGQVVNLQVTETDKDVITLRGLMSARTSPIAWDLRCEIREKLLVWLQAEYPGALPRLRGEMEMRPPDAATGGRPDPAGGQGASPAAPAG